MGTMSLLRVACASGCTTWFYDDDGDGYGIATSTCVCETYGAYTAELAGDCDDAAASVNPGEENCGLSHADGVFRNLAIRHEDAVFRRGRNIEPFDPCERRNQCAQTRHPGKQLPVGCKA